LQQEIQGFDAKVPGAATTPQGLQELAGYLNQRFTNTRFTPQGNGFLYPINGQNLFIASSGLTPPQAA
jgi:hypothetical protein